MTAPNDKPESPANPASSSPPAKNHPGLGEAVRATSLVTLLSRFFGMIRDVLLVQIFGATAIGSAFAAAFQIPNLFRRLFGEGALSAAFVPEYTITAKKDHAAADRLASYTFVRLAIITSIVTVAVELVLLACIVLLPPDIKPRTIMLPAITPGMQTATLTKWTLQPGQTAVPGAAIAEFKVNDTTVPWIATENTTLATRYIETGASCAVGAPVLQTEGTSRIFSLKLMMAMFPFMPAVCMAAILSAMLQVHGRFAASMTGAFFLNAFITAVGVYFLLLRKQGGEFTAYILAAATVLSGFSQIIWFRRLLRPYVKWTTQYDDARPAGVRMLKRFIPVMIGLGGLQLSSFLDLAITMWPIWVGPTILGTNYPLDEKSNIILRSTQLLYSFPLGVFGIAVATAAFPMLARAADQPTLFLDTLRRGLRLSLFIGLPASIGLVLIREDITRVLFAMSPKRGFDLEAVARSASVLLGFAPAIWAYSLNHVLTRAFYAKGDTVTPMRISLVMVVINFVLNCTLIWLPKISFGFVAIDPLREAALAWSTSVCAIVQTIVLMRIAKVRFCPPNEPILDRPTLRAIGRVFTAVIVMGALVGLTKQLWSINPAEPHTYIPTVLRLLVCTAAGGLVYLGEALFSRSPELNWLLSKQKPVKGETPNLSVE